MDGFIYLWFDRKHKRYYIGSHWGAEDDGYICSSRWMKSAYTHRSQDFKRRVLKREIDRLDLINEEDYWFSFIKKEEYGKRYYNLQRPKFHWHINPRKRISVGKKISLANKGKTKSLEHRLANAIGQKGKSLSEETKRKISIAFKGKPKSLEHRLAMSLASKGKSKSLEHRLAMSFAQKENKHEINRYIGDM